MDHDGADYELKACVSHFGNETESGHYTACVWIDYKDSADIKKGWYILDDTECFQEFNFDGNRPTRRAKLESI